MTFDDYVVAANKHVRMHPNQRPGQAYFNVLYRIRPAMADSVRDTPLDPFHRNDVLPNFLAYVAERWDSADR